MMATRRLEGWGEVAVVGIALMKGEEEEVVVEVPLVGKPKYVEFPMGMEDGREE